MVGDVSAVDQKGAGLPDEGINHTSRRGYAQNASPLLRGRKRSDKQRLHTFVHGFRQLLIPRVHSFLVSMTKATAKHQRRPRQSVFGAASFRPPFWVVWLLLLDDRLVLGRALLRFWLTNNGYRTARDANELFTLVGDAGFPYHRRPPLMHGDGGGGDCAVALGAHVIGIDFDAHSSLGMLIDVEPSAYTGAGFRQDHGYSSVQQPERLPRCIGYWHRDNDPILIQFYNFTPEGFEHRVFN